MCCAVLFCSVLLPVLRYGDPDENGKQGMSSSSLVDAVFQCSQNRTIRGKKRRGRTS